MIIILGFVGITLILTSSKQSLALQKFLTRKDSRKFWVGLAHFIGCQLCLGWWIGIAEGFLITTDPMLIVCYGGLNSLISMFFARILFGKLL